jgi:hypothetical protein
MHMGSFAYQCISQKAVYCQCRLKRSVLPEKDRFVYSIPFQLNGWVLDKRSCPGKTLSVDSHALYQEVVRPRSAEMGIRPRFPLCPTVKLNLYTRMGIQT